MIEGVVIKKLTTHSDKRGFFREVIRINDDFFQEGFGQLSTSHILEGVVKAWHFHKKQVDWWYIAHGVLKVALYDMREDSPTFKQTMELLMGDNEPAQVLRIPMGVAHGYKCLKGPADIFYITSKMYDGTDEGRIPEDDVQIGYGWLKK